ncbi:MAG: DUF3108 domain-containing protein [Thermoanaerobaculia bacterium]
MYRSLRSRPPAQSRRLRSRAVGLLGLLVGLAASASPAGARPRLTAGEPAPPVALTPATVSGSVETRPASETLHYRWRIEGFFGALSSLFFPSKGEGSLTATPLEGGNLQSALMITASSQEEPSFFRYEAEIDGSTGRTLIARSSQLWRGKRKDKSSPITDAGAVDVASAIHLLRQKLPTRPMEMEIWSDGRLYPVQVLPVGSETRRISGRDVVTVHYSIRPLTRPDRRVWKGELDLWFARDAHATPVEMLVARPPARLRLELEADSTSSSHSVASGAPSPSAPPDNR